MFVVGPKVAVVGAGPAGFYAAQIIAKGTETSFMQISGQFLFNCIFIKCTFYLSTKRDFFTVV